jgi:hypothetical protein
VAAAEAAAAAAGREGAGRKKEADEQLGAQAFATSSRVLAAR